MSKGDPTNVERAGRAYKTLRYYQDRVRTDREEDIQTILKDALADMMHLARFEKLDWERMEQIARSDFNHEIHDDPDDSPRSWSPRGWRGRK